MDGLLSFPFCGKRVNLNWLGRITTSYEFYAYGICFIRGLHRKKIVYDGTGVLLVVPVWDQIKRE